MGRFYIEHFGGKRIFSCASCETFLTNKDMLMSTRFTGATGRAFLFTRVANLEYSEVQDRVMLTGRHMVRDVACMVCKTKLGWFYEFATDEGQRYKEGKVCKTKLGWFYEFGTDEGQRYKEGKVILERALVQVISLQVCKTKLGWFYEFATDEGQRYKEGKVCKTKLGWFYEFATDEGQRYKEGKVILERALVQESEGFSTERVSDDPEPSPPQADPRERERELVRDLQPNNMIRLLADAHLGNRYDDLPIPILPRHPNQP